MARLLNAPDTECRLSSHCLASLLKKILSSRVEINL